MTNAERRARRKYFSTPKGRAARRAQRLRYRATRKGRASLIRAKRRHYAKTVARGRLRTVASHRRELERIGRAVERLIVAMRISGHG